MSQVDWSRWISRKLLVWVVSVGFIAYGLLSHQIDWNVAMAALGVASAAYMASQAHTDAAQAKAAAPPDPAAVGQLITSAPLEAVADPASGAVLEAVQQLVAENRRLATHLDAAMRRAGQEPPAEPKPDPFAGVG